MQFTIKTNELKALLICAGKKDIRYYLNGVHFESSAHGMIAASTDGHRLLCINLPTEYDALSKALERSRADYMALVDRYEKLSDIAENYAEISSKLLYGSMD